MSILTVSRFEESPAMRTVLTLPSYSPSIRINRTNEIGHDESPSNPKETKCSLLD